jgi:hypothetical protein
MSRFDAPINSSISQRPGLRKRIADLQNEAALFVAECAALNSEYPQTIVGQMENVDRRLRMLRHGVHIVRYEAKMIARAESRLATVKAVQA